MPRRQSPTQADIKRAVKGAQDAGLVVIRVEIDGCKIVLYSSEDARPKPASALDAWRAGNDPR